MSMRVGIEVTAVAEIGIWFTKLDAGDVGHLGLPLASHGPKTIIGVRNPEYRDGSLFFKPSDVVVLNAGASDDALLIDLGTEAEPNSDVETIIKLSGDNSYRFHANRLLRDDALVMAHRLLDAIRSEFSGDLLLGQGRKWVNSPANFVALTIQNRDQNIAITVRGEPDRHPNSPFNLKRDRPGYSRFKISAASEVDRAMTHIRRAANLYNAARGLPTNE